MAPAPTDFSLGASAGGFAPDFPTVTWPQAALVPTPIVCAFPSTAPCQRGSARGAAFEQPSTPTLLWAVPAASGAPYSAPQPRRGLLAAAALGRRQRQPGSGRSAQR